MATRWGVGGHAVMLWRSGPAVMLALAVLLFVAGARRGLDLTDESFYFLSYLHAEEFFGSTTFFGLFLQGLFRSLDYGIGGMRLGGLVLLLGAAAYFSFSLLRHVCVGRRVVWGDAWPWLAVCIASALVYYGFFSTLRAPSYNTLALVFSMIATGLLLQFLDEERSGWRFRLLAMAYGLAVFATFFSKPPAAIAVATAHLAYFLAVNRDWCPVRLATLAASAAIGTAAGVVGLEVAFPRWWTYLRNGLDVGSLLGVPDLLTSVRHLVWTLERTYSDGWVVYLLVPAGTLVAVLALARADRWRSAVVASFVVLSASFLAAVQILAARDTPVFPMLVVVPVTLMAAEAALRWQDLTLRDLLDRAALSALLVGLPLGCSWGTGMPLILHSKTASVFPLALALVAIYRLRAAGMLGVAPYLLTLTLFGLAPVWVQAAPWFSPAMTYRSHQPLWYQDQVVEVGNPPRPVLVDSRLKEDLVKFQELLGNVGFVRETAILDLTGDGVGLVFAAGGRPLGAGWILGGYPGSDRLLEKVLDGIDPQVLGSAWLITSEDNPRRSRVWRSALTQRIGDFPFAPVGEVCLRWPYRWREDVNHACYHVTVWAPAGAGLRLEPGRG